MSSKKINDKIIKEFKEAYTPQSIASAEALTGRWIAGDSIEDLGFDYGFSTAKVERALRFFLVVFKQNLEAKALYDEWQRARFEVKL